ncbi:xanthine dehydrogenase subunit D [Paenibacillus alginolyticus]|uniref:Xanthine dehydrogenase subunit D n=1 Tax=Paenibacillus alginolyticus TaxID=59839 RepID=A0ABT4GIL4_9BACL|nr:xanthine dehydrogenase subunit D [Paenibacillus alginolyticus]MCY9695961.1 xanthine dehydrogenase subunit D [Paenibacillus alginolyticus]MEC0146815.1 xanthine dehydrogenase subunit D [Paenibacillus alginolyticus]
MLLGRDTYAKKWIIRPDGEEKVTGKLRYLTDLTAPGMLHGKVLRSRYPHAWILSIDISKAIMMPGVRVVVTAEDVPGMNLFGIAFPHQPVFCHDRVRYIGDALAAVAADTEEIAEYALSLIEVDYEPLPVVDDPETALDAGAIRLHPGGNLLHRTSLKHGETETAFEGCAHIAQETYYTPRQMHTYMETEGGLFIPEDDGRLTVYSPTQHGYKDRMQLSRILAMDEEQIRVVSSPIGGSFGGKDELNVQPFGALMALKTGSPIKMHNSRRESVISGIKRHPMRIQMKTGVDQEGRLIAHQVSILADTGAYATLGCEVLNFATEHAIGPYNIPNIDVQGTSVYTNNGVSGEFRGFGGNQVIFAVESQIERLAEKLGMDSWELRKLNLRAPGDPGPMGQQIVQTEGADQVWSKVKESPLWAKREKPERGGDGAVQQGDGEKQQDHTVRLQGLEQNHKSEDQAPWIRRGVGAAMVMHGAGLGLGIPDHSGGRIELTPEGKIQASFGFEEFGQGLYAALTLMLQDFFGCTAEDVRIVIGDTDRVPSSGSSTASRATTMMWRALQRLKPPFVQALLQQASALVGLAAEELATGAGGIHRKGDEPGKPVVTYAELAEAAEAAAQPIIAHTEFDYPTTPEGLVGAHYLYSYASVIVEVEVNMLTGRVKVLQTDHVIAAGPVINPMGFLGQIEGGSVMALGYTLTEDAVMKDSNYVRHNLDTYLVPTFKDSPPAIRVEAIEDLPEGDTFGPRGVGEIGSVGLAPAITAAVRQATGIWVNRLPISPEDIVQSIDWLEGVEAID